MDKDELSRSVAAHQLATKKALEFSEVTLGKLRKEPDTSNNAKFLANICVQLDVGFGAGSQLTLEWMINNYLGMEYFNNVSSIVDKLYAKLVEGKHTYVNTWEHDSGYVYYIPAKRKSNGHDDMKVMVMTNEHLDWSWLVIVDANIISEKVFVRKIWKRTVKKYDFTKQPDKATLKFYRDIKFDLSYKNDVYGDSRDNGHIMSYKSIIKYDYDTKVRTKLAGECDAGMHYLPDHTRWFFEMGCLDCSLDEE